MTKTLVWAGLTAVSMMFVGSAALAGPISNACIQSSRQAASPSLCTCIQQVADLTLQGADQRRAATFFRDPDKAQEAFLSQNRADDAFWVRYKAFGSQAEQRCSG